MSSPPLSKTLIFTLPGEARADSALAHRPVFGCFSHGKRTVTVLGRSREAVFAEAARILRIACAGMPAQSIEARLYTPERDRDDGRDWLSVGSPHVDGWTIIVNADIAFAPTALGVNFPMGGADAQAPPEALERRA